MATKNCSRCNKPFTCCNEKSGCWCENLTLDTEALSSLRNEFANCLCEDCLKIYAQPQSSTK